MDSPRRSPVLWIAALVALAHGASFLSVGPCDDDYIVYRYAANLVAGEGPVFNPGERVEGFTVPLWMLLIAAGDLVGLAGPLVSALLGLVAQVWIVLSLCRLWSLLVPTSRWPVPALLAAAAPALGYHAALGLGTNLLAAVITAAAADAAEGTRRGTWLAALWLGLAALLRHEALLFTAAFLVPTLRRGPRPAAGLALVLPGAWFLFRWLYYGRLLPITWDVKKLGWSDDLAYGLEYLGRGTLETGIGLWIVLALVAFVGPGRGATAGLRWVGAGLGLHVAYVVAVGGDYMALARFFVPSLPLLLLFACLPFAALACGPGRLAFVVALLVLQAGQLERPRLRETYAFQEERWIAIGKTLGIVGADTLTYPDGPPSVAVSPIGAIGLHSGAPIVDLLGITHTGFLDQEPDLSITMKGHHRHDAQWILERAPDLVILGNGARPAGTETMVVSAWERPLFEDPRFAERYRSMQLPIVDSYPLIFYVREGARAPAGSQPARQR